MSIGEHLLHALEFKTVFSFKLGNFTVPVTETVIFSWAAMAILLIGAFLLTRNLKEIPQGSQSLLETVIEFLNSFCEQNFGHHWRPYAPYIGTVFLFLIALNFIAIFTPVSAFGFHAPFVIKPPTRDINVTAAFAIVSILVVLGSGLKVRGVKGWLKRLAYPVPMMVPFSLLEYLIRPTALCLRLFGNILGGFIIMELLAAIAPLVVPSIAGLYFDIIDGLIQATVFTYLTMVFIAEAIE